MIMKRNYKQMDINGKRFNVYQGEKDGFPLSIIADFNFDKISSKQNYPCFLWIRIEMKNIDSKRQPTKEEDILLNDFEDKIVEEILKSNDAYYIGRVTWNKDRRIYLYVANAESTDQVLQTLIRNPIRPLEYRIEKDEEWLKIKEIFTQGS